MNKFTRLTSVIVLILSIFMFASTSFANINDPALKKQYDDLVKEGTIDSKSVDYNSWAQMYLEGKAFEEQVANEVRNEQVVEAASIGSNKQVVKPAYTKMEAGDIFVTTSTSSSGLTGHAAIAISSTAILHMPGSKQTSKILSYAEWKKKYDDPGSKTWIYRHSNRAMAQKAADWARKNYWNSNGGGAQNIFPKYSIISGSLGRTNPSYCSLLVWQAYYYAGTGIVRTPYITQTVPPYYLKPDHLSTLWKTKPKLVATITNYY